MKHWVLLLILSIQIIGLTSDETGIHDDTDVSSDSITTTPDITTTLSISDSTAEAITSTVASSSTSTDPSSDPTTVSNISPTTNPSTDYTTISTTDSSSDYTIDSSSDYTTDSSSDYTTDSTSNYTTDSTSNYTTDSSSDYTTDSSSEYTTDSSSDYTTDSSSDYTTNPATDNTTDPVTDPTSDSTPDSSTSSTFDSTTTEDTTSSSHTTTSIDTNSTTTDLTNYTTSHYSTDTNPSSPFSSTTPAVTTEDSTTSVTPTDTTTDGVTEPAQQGVNGALLFGILIPVLLMGVTLILYLGYRSGRLHWPPKSIFSQAPDGIQPSYIPLKKFPAHCDQLLEVPSKLSNEYQQLATLSADITNAESFIAAQIPDNKVKNRYVNILPYDSTRVKLTPEGDDYFSDYINASYIKGYMNEIEYIATQGPKAETCRDFWRMVFQEPIKVIVMVTQLEEMGKPKCYKYFPNLREKMALEDISVWCTTELHFPIYTLRTLVLAKDDRKRSITHLHFREWPDFGCPSTPDLMLQFCQVMRQYINMAQPGITLVHCSAGVGRTGTLIAVDILLQQVSENKKISVFDTVYKLRKQRINMVQSEAQYAYIYKCLKEAVENPSYLSSENSSTTSAEPIYENVECTRFSPSNKIPQDTVFSESECAF